MAQQVLGPGGIETMDSDLTSIDTVGEQTRDFTCVEDAVRVKEQLLADGGKDEKILNIGSTDNIDILTLAQGIRVEIDSSLDIEIDAHREGDAEYTHADLSKAKELIGYELTRAIQEGVRKFIAWYQENRNW